MQGGSYFPNITNIVKKKACRHCVSFKKINIYKSARFSRLKYFVSDYKFNLPSLEELCNCHTSSNFEEIVLIWHECLILKY